MLIKHNIFDISTRSRDPHPTQGNLRMAISAPPRRRQWLDTIKPFVLKLLIKFHPALSLKGRPRPRYTFFRIFYLCYCKTGNFRATIKHVNLHFYFAVPFPYVSLFTAFGNVDVVPLVACFLHNVHVITTTATNETMTHRLLRVTNFPIGSFHRL